jgi:hypothetical protein
VLLVCGIVRAAEPAFNTLTDAEKQAGWKLMFDGTSTGWHTLGAKDMPKGWNVDQDALHHLPKGGGGDLTTNDLYENFELLFEWKVAPNTNSGVKYRVQEQAGKSSAFGIEYQVIDQVGKADNQGKHAVASLYDVFAPKDARPKPVGEWNQSKILVKGNHIEHWLNGIETVEAEYGSDAWKEAVAKSKFKNSPSYGNPAKGHIILQDHGDEVWFRNIKIRELKD